MNLKIFLSIRSLPTIRTTGQYPITSVFRKDTHYSIIPSSHSSNYNPGGLTIDIHELFTPGPGRQRKPGTRGFTLLEILLAFLIFAIVISTIYASYTSTFHVIGTAEAQAEIYRQARIAMGRIMDDLESAYYSDQAGTVEEFIGKDNEIDGARADSLRFVSRAHIVFSGQEVDSGKASIEYEVRPSETGAGLTLFRHDRPELMVKPLEEDTGFLLCDNLKAVRFTYYDAAGEEHDRWDSTGSEFAGLSPRDSIPRAVSVLLQFESEPELETPYTFVTRVLLPVSKGGEN